MSKKTSNPGELFNPFPGLRPFSQDESHLFFGREGQSKSVLESLEANNFVAVIGASGSGKSSLIYCGVIPELVQQSQSKWYAVSTRPGTSPIENLVASISKSFKGKVKDDDAEKLKKGETTIQQWVQGIVPKGEHLLLVVDQFEEIFRFKATGSTDKGLAQVSSFVELLYEACSSAEQTVSVVITMRSDFIGECSIFQNLTDLINKSNYLIPQMTRDDFRKAIEGPVAVGGATIEEALVEQLLEEMGIDTDQLPVLQHALMRTWDYWMLQNDKEKPISIGDYEAIGRMEKALSDHANEAYDELNEGQRLVCENIFKALTEKGGDNRGVRRPSTVDRVAAITRSSSEEIIEIAEVFRIKGRTFLTPYQPVVITPETVIDISHESLMRIWDRLRLWVDEESTSVDMYNKLSEASSLFQDGTSGLWRPPDLSLALNWREKQHPTATWAVQYNPAFERAMVFLDTSDTEFKKAEENKIRLQKRRLRITRIFSLVLGFIAVVAMGMFLWTRDLQSESEARRILAEEKTIIADEKTQEALDAVAAAELSRDSAEDARVEALRQQGLAEDATDLATSEAERATQQQRRAEQSAQDALDAQAETEVRRLEAVEAQELALENEAMATQRRMLSIAKSMAVKSDQMRADTLLKGLLAYQAFSFNKEYEGIDYDPDIFKAAYTGLKFFKGDEFNLLSGHTSLVRTLETGSAVYSGGSDGQVIKWDIEGGSSDVIMSGLSIVRKLIIADGSLYCLTANAIIKSDMEGNNPDVYEGAPGAIDMIRLGSGDLLAYQDRLELADDYKKKGRNFYKAQSRINAIEYIRDKGQLFVAQSNGQILKWDFLVDGSSAEAEVFADVAGANWSTLRYNSNQNLLTAGAGTGEMEGELHLWNLVNNEKMDPLRSHTASVSRIRYNSDGSLMASASLDGTVCIWHLEDLNTLPIIYEEDQTWVTSILFTDDDKYVITGDKLGSVRKLPTSIDLIIQDYCSYLSRELTLGEWQNYVGTDVEYKPAKCEN